MKSTQTPEESEFQQKEKFLRQRQDVLTELELSLSTLQAKLRSFEVEYYLKVGSRYVQIDQLQATLDKVLASKIPFDATAQTRAAQSQERAAQSASDAEDFTHGSENRQGRFDANPELKSLYRELVKLLHPDLTLDSDEKERRHRLIQQINEAYQSGQIGRLRDILDSERNSPDLIKGDDVGSSLLRTIRKTAQVEKRIMDLEKELEILRQTDLYLLFDTVTREMKNGNNLLKKMSDELDAQIIFLQRRIDQVNR